MLIFYSLLALTAGFLVAGNRIMNAKLGENCGALASSVWNHSVGFIVLVPVVLYLYGTQFIGSTLDIPPIYYLGGVIGGMFVGISSYIIPKIGAMRTIILVICGQTIGGVGVDFALNRIKNIEIALIGVLLLIIGGSIAKLASSRQVSKVS